MSTYAKGTRAALCHATDCDTLTTWAMVTDGLVVPLCPAHAPEDTTSSASRQSDQQAVTKCKTCGNWHRADDCGRCPGCGHTFRGRRGLRTHQSRPYMAMGCLPPQQREQQ